MDTRYEKTLGTILTALGIAILLFGFYQAYEYTQSPPSGSYNLFSFGGGGGGLAGNSSISGSFNGRALVTFMFLGIEYLVGASILKAGWNLITPKAETIQVRVKPRSLQVEPVGASIPSTSSPPALNLPTPVASPSIPPVSTAPVAPAWAEGGASPPAQV